MPVGHVVHRLALPPVPPTGEQEPWIHAVPGSGGVGRSRRDRSPAVSRGVAHHGDSGGNNDPNVPHGTKHTNGRSICSGSTNHATHRE